MGYLIPADVPVSASWQDHRDRQPPSGEPGTDLATAYGTDLRIASDGVVAVVDHSPSGAEGRRCSIDLDDGRRVSYIHLAGISAYVGMRVGKGQTGVIWSGASGHGSDHGYDPHVHVSLWERPGMPFADTIDFMLYLDADPIPGPTIPMEDAMPQFFEPNTIVWPNGWANSYDAQVYQAMKSYVRDPDNPSTQWVRDTYIRESWAALEGVQKQQVKIAEEATASTASHPLSAPAWIAGGLLGLIGLVEVIRLVVDVLT